MKYTFALILIMSISIGAPAQQIKTKSSVIHNTDYQSVQISDKFLNLKDTKTEKEKDFTFAVNPYFWAEAIGGTVGLPNTVPYQFNVEFSDAVENLTMAFMFAGRFKYKSVSLLYDVSYIKLSPELYVPYANLGGYKSGSATFKEFVGDFSLGYRIPLNDKSVQLDCYGGVRVWSMDNTINLTEASSGTVFSNNSSKTWVDPVFGAGANFDFAEDWFTYLKGDIGGFGASSDFTSVFMWGIGYKFDKHWNTSLGLKNLYIDYDNDKFDWNVWQYGLLLSAGYRL